MKTRRPSACALLGLLFACAAACEREPPTLVRPWADAADVASFTFDGTTMLGRRLGPKEREETWILGPTGAGDVGLAVALEGSAGARATLTLAGAATATPCVVDAPGRWHPCRFTLDRAVPQLALRAELAGPSDARLTVSSPLVRSGSPSPALVIVILMDTARFDRLVTYEPRVPLAPALDRLAKDGVVFERAYSSSSWTRTAVATLLTGLDASSHGVLEREDTLPPDLDSLPLALQRAGFRTVAWSTNPNVLPIWGFAAGFDAFHDIGALLWPKVKVTAASVFAAARAFLGDSDARPAFLYLHLMDPHAPYRPQAGDLQAVQNDAALLATFPGDAPTPMVQLEYAQYLAEIRGMDREIGLFLDELRAHHWYDDATILAVADHGEEFLDHGLTRHGKTLYEEVLRIPMILKLPRNALAGTRLASEVGLADIGPTLLGAIGVGGLSGVDGRNLWDGDHHHLRDEGAAQTAVIKLDTHHKAALVTERRKLIIDYFDADQLFDVVADPRERRNLLPEEAPAAQEMRAAIDVRIARHEAGWHVRICGGDGTERQRLRIQVRGDARGTLLEMGDAIRLVTRRDTIAEYEADVGLAPRPSERLVNGRIWKGLRPDEDEVVAPAPDAITLTIAAATGDTLHYALGVASAQTEALDLSVSAADPAVRVRPSDPVDCRPQSWNDVLPPEGRRSYLRIWYVPHADRLDAGQIDRALQERLRALGYQQ